MIKECGDKNNNRVKGKGTHLLCTSSDEGFGEAKEKRIKAPIGRRESGNGAKMVEGRKGTRGGRQR